MKREAITEMPIRVGIDCRMSLRSGMGRYIKNLVRRLDLPEMVVFRSKSSPGDELGPHGHRTRLVDSPIFSLREQRELPRAIRAEKLDLFHTPHFNLPVFSPVPVVTTIHDCALDRFPRQLPSFSAGWYYRAMMFAAVRRSTAIIVDSQATRDDLMRFHRAPEEKVEVIPLGVDLERFSPKPNDPAVLEIRRRFKLEGETILYVGLSHPHKNLRLLMRALRRVVNSSLRVWRSLKLVCAGPSMPRFPAPAELAKQESISGSVVQAGWLSDDDLVALMRGSSLLVLPSLVEGFGLPALEAMACGVPVLLSEIPALRETAGSAAEYFDPGSEGDLAEKLQSLLENAERRQELAEKGRKRASQFTWEACVRKTLDVYQRVISAKALAS